MSPFVMAMRPSRIYFFDFRVQQFKTVMLRRRIDEWDLFQEALTDDELRRLHQSIFIACICGCPVVEDLLVDENEQILVLHPFCDSFISLAGSPAYKVTRIEIDGK